MAHIVNLKKILEPKGNLITIDQVLPFTIKRVYYISDVPSDVARGGHKHRKNIQALVCIRGSCEVIVADAGSTKFYLLDAGDKCLILQPQDWHLMQNFSQDAILLVMASEPYDPDDYITAKDKNHD